MENITIKDISNFIDLVNIALNNGYHNSIAGLVFRNKLEIRFSVPIAKFSNKDTSISILEILFKFYELETSFVGSLCNIDKKLNPKDVLGELAVTPINEKFKKTLQIFKHLL